jgi:hypothetical protein
MQKLVLGWWWFLPVRGNRVTGSVAVPAGIAVLAEFFMLLSF